MRSKYRFLAVAALVFAAPAAWADPPAEPSTNLPETRWSDSAEIVIPSGIIIPGMKRCPTMWKLKRGDSTLFILGTLYDAPENAAWDSSCFAAVLKGAKRIVKSDFLPGPFDYQPDLPAPQTLKDVVSPAIYARFLATAAREKVDTKDLETRKPIWAGAGLTNAVMHKYHIRFQPYADRISRLVRQACPGNRSHCLVMPRLMRRPMKAWETSTNI